MCVRRRNLIPKGIFCLSILLLLSIFVSANNVTVYVYDYETMNMVDNVTISFHLGGAIVYTCVTNSSGMCLSILGNDSYILLATNSNYETYNNIYTISNDTDIGITMRSLLGYSAITIILDDFGLNKQLCFNNITDCYNATAPINLINKDDYQFAILPLGMDIASYSGLRSVLPKFIFALITILIIIVLIGGFGYAIRHSVLG